VLVTAAFVPAAPVLVPRVAGGAAAELDEVRTACLAAISTTLAALPERVIVLASGPGRRWPAQRPSFSRLGLDDGPADDRPVALQLGRWLLEEAGWAGPVEDWTVDGSSTPDLGSAAVAVLVAGDGTARRSPSAPGYFDPAAEAYDEAVAEALAAVDTATLLSLDPADDRRLLVQGRAAWQAAARAADAEPGDWSGALLWSGAPLGVGYFVATWRR
jgi:hypothetical protein